PTRFAHIMPATAASSRLRPTPSPAFVYSDCRRSLISAATSASAVNSWLDSIMRGAGIQSGTLHGGVEGLARLGAMPPALACHGRLVVGAVAAYHADHWRLDLRLQGVDLLAQAVHV